MKYYEQDLATMREECRNIADLTNWIISTDPAQLNAMVEEQNTFERNAAIGMAEVRETLVKPSITCKKRQMVNKLGIRLIGGVVNFAYKDKRASTIWDKCLLELFV